MSAEELIRYTKPITVATGKAVAAGNSGRQEDVIIAANSGRKAVSDLLRACKVSNRTAQTQTDGRGMVQLMKWERDKQGDREGDRREREGMRGSEGM